MQDFKQLQKLVNAHISECSNIRVQNILHVQNNIMYIAQFVNT